MTPLPPGTPVTWKEHGKPRRGVVVARVPGLDEIRLAAMPEYLTDRDVECRQRDSAEASLRACGDANTGECNSQWLMPLNWRRDGWYVVSAEVALGMGRVETRIYQAKDVEARDA